MNCELHLRAPEPSDLDALYRWENDPCEWRSTGHGPLSRQRLWQYIQDYDGDIFATGELRLIIVHNGEAVGCVDLTDFDPRHLTAKVGIYIAPQWRRQGLGAKALEALLTYAREVVGMRGLMALVAADNTASLTLFARAGYRQQGLLTHWLGQGHDLLILTRQ